MQGNIKKELNVPFLIFIKKFDIIYIENEKEGKNYDCLCCILL